MKKIFYGLSLVLAFTFLGNNSVAAQETKSRKAKNTAIGAGVGAVTGAAVSKKKKKGAVIGGAVGAAGGYMYGRHRDKTKGRKIKD